MGISGLATCPQFQYEVHYRDSIVDPEQYVFPDTIPAVALSTQ